MIKEKISRFYGSKFQYEGKLHVVKDCKERSEKAMIFTDRRTFAFYEAELDEFLLKIKFIDMDAKVSSEAIPAVAVENEIKIEAPEPAHTAVTVQKRVEVVTVERTIRAEIIESNDRAARMALKLEEMFDRLSDAPTDEMLKQAKAMQDLSNSIVNVEMMKFKLLTIR